MNEIEQIEKHETQLKLAMLQSDISTLDKLLSPKLIFTNHLGHVMTKQDDLSAHQSGLFQINNIHVSDQKIIILLDSAIVTVKTQIIGQFEGKVSDSHFRFTRIWKKVSNSNWQVIVGHSSIIV